MAESNAYFGNIVYMLEHKGEVAEAVADHVNRTFEKEGVAYYAGVAVANVVLIKAMSGAVKNVKTTGAEDDIARAMESSDDISNVDKTISEVGDVTDDYAKVSELDNIAKAGDDVVGVTGEGDASIIHNDVLDSPRTGSALTVDEINPQYAVDSKTGRAYIVQEFPARAQAHGFNDIIDNYAGYATKTSIENGVLYQLEGSLNGVSGRFEWIIQDGKVTHRMFIKNGTVNGVPIKS